MKKIRVLECIRQGNIGGGETHVLELVDGINTKFFTPIVLSFTDGPMVEKLKSQHIETHVIHTERPFNFLAWGKVRDLIIREKIDFIHAHGSRACSNILHVGKKLNIPIIYTIHGWSFHPGQNSIIKKLRIRSEKYLTRNTDLNICVSKSNMIEGEELFDLKNTVVIYNGTKLEKVNEDEVGDDVRFELGIDSETLLIGFIGRMTWQKSPLLLIKACARLVGKYPHIKLLMVGEGELKKQAITEARRLGMMEKFIFEPFREDIPALLKAIDIYCLPSLWEGFSIGLLEALAMKKAVVASAVNGTKEIITDRINGLLINPGDVDDLINKLEELITNQELRIKLGIQAFHSVKNTFSTSKMISAIEDHYQRIFNQRRIE